MDNLEKLTSNINIPKMVRIRQHFPGEEIKDIPDTIRRELYKDGIINRIKKDDRVAVTAGSRGIANISIILKEIVNVIKEKGAHPFLVPSMGSHGGATAEGQIEVLKELGITEESVGAPIRSTMEVIQVGKSKNGLPVCIDKYAHTEADAIVIVGRIKPHTSFRGAYESGLAKMAVIGLGKQIGAEICHSKGSEEMSARIEEMARTAIEKSKIAFAVGIIENAYDETSQIAAIPAEGIMDEEPELLLQAKRNLPSIMFRKCEVLVVDQIGKNIAGTGLDPNIVRSSCAGSIKFDPLAQRIVILDLTKETHGNAAGMGNADICTKRLFDKINYSITNANPLTNRAPQIAKMPMMMQNDRQAIKAAVKTCVGVEYKAARIIRIKNTLKIDEILISENLLEEAMNNPDIEILGEPEYMEFDHNGNLW